MIGSTIQIRLQGVALTAFQTYCARHGFATASEGIETMIRELLPEYRQLAQTHTNSRPVDSQEQNEPTA